MRFNSKRFKNVFTHMRSIWKLLMCVCVCLGVYVCVCCYYEAPACAWVVIQYHSIIMVLCSIALKLKLYKIFLCKLSMISLLKAVSVYSLNTIDKLNCMLHAFLFVIAFNVCRSYLPSFRSVQHCC